MNGRFRVHVSVRDRSARIRFHSTLFGLAPGVETAAAARATECGTTCRDASAGYE
jgi:hypothetical protein